MSENHSNSEVVEEGKVYTLTNASKKCSYESDHYSKYFSGKKVTLIVTTIFRWGEFEVTLTDREKNEMLSEDVVCVNDYCSSFVSNVDGCEQTEEIKDLDSYSEEEKRAIYEDIYEDVENNTLYDTSELEDNGWSLGDTIYEIVGGVILSEPEENGSSLDDSTRPV